MDKTCMREAEGHERMERQPMLILYLEDSISFRWPYCPAIYRLNAISTSIPEAPVADIETQSIGGYKWFNNLEVEEWNRWPYICWFQNCSGYGMSVELADTKNNESRQPKNKASGIGLKDFQGCKGYLWGFEWECLSLIGSYLWILGPQIVELCGLVGEVSHWR